MRMDATAAKRSSLVLALCLGCWGCSTNRTGLGFIGDAGPRDAGDAPGKVADLGTTPSDYSTLPVGSGGVPAMGGIPTIPATGGLVSTGGIPTIPSTGGLESTGGISAVPTSGGLIATGGTPMASGGQVGPAGDAAIFTTTGGVTRTGGTSPATGGTSAPNCGHTGQPCCAGDLCSATGTQCTNSECVACGGKGEDCCPGNACADGGCCVTSTSTGVSRCVASGNQCTGSIGGVCAKGACGKCGGLDQVCCSSDRCTASYTRCQVSFTSVVASACVACGASGQPCCGSGIAANRVCQSGLACSSSAGTPGVGPTYTCR